MRKFVIAIAVMGALLLATSFLRSRVNLGDANLGKYIDKVDWSACDGLGAKYFDIKSIKVNGDFKVGSTATFEINGNVLTPFTHASDDIEAKFGFIGIFNGNVPVNPPVAYAAGPAQMLSSSKVTQDPPTGGYTLTIRIKDEKNTKLQCVKLTYTLKY